MPLFNGELSGSLTDRSGTLAAANVSQPVMAANANRNLAFVSNPSSSVTLWINIFGGTAVANGSGSFALPPLQSWSGNITNAINIVGNTISTPYTAGEL